MCIYSQRRRAWRPGSTTATGTQRQRRLNSARNNACSLRRLSGILVRESSCSCRFARAPIPEFHDLASSGKESAVGAETKALNIPSRQNGREESPSGELEDTNLLLCKPQGIPETGSGMDFGQVLAVRRKHSRTGGLRSEDRLCNQKVSAKRGQQHQTDSGGSAASFHIRALHA